MVHRTRNISQIVYATGALLEKAKLGRGFACNCDSDVSKSRHTGLKYNSLGVGTDVGCSTMHAPVT